MPSRVRWRMKLRSISANAAWICRKARPAGVVVSIGELRALNPTLRDSRSSTRATSCVASRRRRSRFRTTRTSSLRRWSCFVVNVLRATAAWGVVAAARLLERVGSARPYVCVSLRRNKATPITERPAGLHPQRGRPAQAAQHRLRFGASARVATVSLSTFGRQQMMGKSSLV